MIAVVSKQKQIALTSTECFPWVWMFACGKIHSAVLEPAWITLIKSALSLSFSPVIWFFEKHGNILMHNALPEL